MASTAAVADDAPAIHRAPAQDREEARRLQGETITGRRKPDSCGRLRQGGCHRDGTTGINAILELVHLTILLGALSSRELDTGRPMHQGNSAFWRSTNINERGGANHKNRAEEPDASGLVASREHIRRELRCKLDITPLRSILERAD